VKRKPLILLIIIAVFFIVMIPVNTIEADPVTSGTSLNLYLGNEVDSDSYVKFGQFGGQEILWRVLRQDDGTNGVLLLSDVILESRIYDDGAPWNVWADSDIRDYLNSTFYNNLGTDKSYIKTVTVSTVDGDTNDKIFLPSIAIMQASPFNSATDSDTKRIAYYNGTATDYWTLTRGDTDPGTNVYYERYVSLIGDLQGSRNVYVSSTKGVRPMFYLIPGLLFSGSGSSSDPYMITNPTSAKIPLSPEDWVLLNLNITQLVGHYGASSLGLLYTLYDNILGRVPDEDGLNYWNTQLNNSLFTASQIIEHFIFSDELGSKIEDMTNGEFINFLYNSLFARMPDADGYNQWLSFMASGNSKLDTLRAFLNNEEWINICILFNVTP